LTTAGILPTNHSMRVLSLILTFVAASVVLAVAGVTGPALVAVAIVIVFIVGMALPDARERCEFCASRLHRGARVCHRCGRAQTGEAAAV
jgi:hypothetical protein